MRKFLVNVNGVSYEVAVEEMSDTGAVPAAQPVSRPVQAAPAEAPQPAAPQTVSVPQGGEKITSPMPGTILEVQVKVGDIVRSGDVMFILEAMKLENEIIAPRDGKVTAINTVRGASVSSGDLLCVIV